jgi:ketosteroid isomerase-like protein
MSAENIDLVRRGYAAFSAADVDTLRGLFTEDVTWTVPGNGPVSGVKQGQDAVLGYFGELAGRAGGSLKVDLMDVASGESYVFARARITATRNGTDLDTTDVNVFEIVSGKTRSVQQYFAETAEWDAFWA